MCLHATAPKPAVEKEEVKEKSKEKKKNKEDQIAKYRELLQSIQDKERSKERDRDMEMEITWVPGEGTFPLSHEETMSR